MAVSPLHDCDEKKDKATWDNNNDLIINGKHYKKPHYHVLYIAKNPVTVESVQNMSDVITANAGGFRLYFDANCQMGYRYNRKPKIDKETGEILDIEK